MTILQRTIKNKIQTKGIGVHSGDKVTLTLRPAPVDTGIVFYRTDLDTATEIKLDAFLVKETQLCTGLVSETGVRVQTIEHLMAAVSSFGIDNLYIDIDSPEIPIMDGSSAQFVLLLQQAQVVEQDAPKKFIRITKKIRVEDGDKYAELSPIEDNRFNLDFTIEFNHPVITKELSHFNMNLTTNNFIEQLSQCRTFGFMKDIEYLQSIGLCRGGSLENAIVLDTTKILNPEDLRFKDEFVRHKMLDAIGDLYLANHNIIGAYKAFKSGHYLNNLLVRKLLESKDCYEIVEFEDDKQSLISFATKI